MIDLTDCENFLQIISQLENTGKINIEFIPFIINRNAVARQNA